MRNFTSKMKALFSLVVMVFAAVTASAQASTPAELYGKYEFTADMEITADGQKYSEYFKNKCTVVVSPGTTDFIICGIGGSDGENGPTANLKGGNMYVTNPNGANYGNWKSIPVYFANENGDNPFGVSSSYNPTYIVNEDKTITIPNFTFVEMDQTFSFATVMVKFTNCKLTMTEQEEVEYTDLSGEYHFTSLGTGNTESSFPMEFDMTVTATSDDFKSYTVVMNFGEDYLPVTLEGTFDGYVLSLPFYDNYLNEEQTLAFASFKQPSNLFGDITFQKESARSLYLNSGLNISRLDTDANAWASDQYYIGGYAVLPTEDADNFAGTYHVVATNFWQFIDADDNYGYTCPQEFDFTIEKTAFDGIYRIYDIMGGNMYNNTYGSNACEVSGNTLKMPVGPMMLIENLYMSEDWDVMVYTAFYDGLGEGEGSVDLTIDEEGNITMGDFFMFRKTMKYNSSWQLESEDYDQLAFYGDLKVTRKGEGGDAVVAVKADAGNVYVENGAIRVAGEPAAVQVYNAAGACVFNGVTSVVNGLNKGLYIVKCGGATVKVVL